jgi:hypothetical protein
VSDALACDGPGCDTTAVVPFLGWWTLDSASLAVRFGEPDRLHFCSWPCLGAFVLEKSGDVAELQRRIADL